MSPKQPSMKNIAGQFIRPIPIPFYQPLLRKLVLHVVSRHPSLFDRLESCQNRVIEINPLNLPVIFQLIPNKTSPQLRAYRRGYSPIFDAQISASFLTLLRMVDGQLDGDAEFFSRGLKIQGDTETIVCLRNALDDMDGSIVDDMTDFLGPLKTPFLSTFRTGRRA